MTRRDLHARPRGHARAVRLRRGGGAGALRPPALASPAIGPKVALAIVSGSTPGELRRAIALDDTARFEAIPGIGKKTAQRVVLELKEKLGSGPSRPAARGRRRRRTRGARRPRRARLLAVEAERALAAVDPDLPAEERVRLALRSAA